MNEEEEEAVAAVEVEVEVEEVGAMAGEVVAVVLIYSLVVGTQQLLQRKQTKAPNSQRARSLMAAWAPFGG